MEVRADTKNTPNMNQLLLIEALEKQISQRMNRLNQATSLNLEQELERLRICQALTQAILKND